MVKETLQHYCPETVISSGTGDVAAGEPLPGYARATLFHRTSASPLACSEGQIEERLMFGSMTAPGPRRRETQSQEAKGGQQTQPPTAAFLGLSHRQQTRLALALAGSDPLSFSFFLSFFLPPTPRLTFCGWLSSLKSAVSLKTATGGACGTSLNTDMARGRRRCSRCRRRRRRGSGRFQ